MKTMLLAAAAAFTLAGCGDTASSEETLRDRITPVVDEQALASAVDQAVDQKALEQAALASAQGAVRSAIEDVIPAPTPEMQAIGAAVDERALVKGIGEAVDGKALEQAIERSADGAVHAQ